MITIQIIGLDHFVVGQYSREHLDNLAQLFESDSDLINFASTETVLLHNGVEQTSWNALVIVRAPHQYEAVEKDVADYLLTTLSPFAIHIEVEFDYFEPHSHYQRINPDYPRYITASQVHDITFDDEEEEEEGECGHDHEHEEAAPEDIYLGNAFEGFEEKFEQAQAEKEKK